MPLFGNYKTFIPLHSNRNESGIIMPFEKGQSGNPNQQFKKGVTGNPLGRPPVTDIKKYIQARLNEPSAEGANTTRLDLIVAKLLQQAFSGNMKALQLAMEYGFGKPTQQIAVTGPNDTPLFNPDFSKFTYEQLSALLLSPAPVTTDTPTDPQPDNSGESKA
jgi:hypothetical protein